MRILISLLLVCVTFSLRAQTDLSPEAWREDLRFLQHTVHQDYPFLFKKVDAETFDKEVEKLYKAIPQIEDHEVIVGLARIVSLFQYGHTALGLNAWYDHKGLGVKQMPYNLMQFKDGVFVQGVHKDYADALGAKVIKVAGMPIEEAMSAVRPAFPTENEQFFKVYGLHLLGNPAVLHAQGVTKKLEPEITLTLEKGGKTFDLAFKGISTQHFPGHYGFIQQSEDWLDARDQSNTPLWLDQLDKIYYYKYLPEQKTVYIRHSQIQDDPAEDIPTFYARVFDFIENNDVDKLILDVRLNGGGNNYKNKPIVTGVIRSDKINQVGHFFVITGGRTFSACQNLVNELHTYTNAIFVGEPTGENINFYGDNRPVELPNSHLTARLSFAWWQDKPQWEGGQWLPPQVAIEPTFADYQANRDPVLDAIWGFDDEDIILDPMGYLEKLFRAGEIEKVTSESARLVHDPLYAYYDFEAQFNRAGYNLLGDKQFDAALFVFDMTAKLFPHSPNAWDSLAEGHWKAGHLDKAREYYQKAMAMDPDGATGANAKKMLEEMDK
ncbi:MAG: tetratricopeptide repeat protein [Saprospiraceae bacterium]